jgi:endonuclease/exonuclease/phosphatase family metal-dependent hydrolase
MTFEYLHAARRAEARRVVLCLAVAFLFLTAAGCTRGGRPASEDGSAAAERDAPRAHAASDSARSDGSLRLATLNTEFLFDGRGDEGRTGFVRSGAPQAAQAHLKRVARLLGRLDADVVMLQEVENADVLNRLARSALLEGMNYAAHFVQGTDHFTGQDMGLLARVPVTATGRTDERARVGSSSEDYGVSKNLYARLRWQGTPITLIGVHFLARPTDRSRTDKREAQAEVIRRLVVAEQDAGRAPVVLGDFNDFSAATPDVASSRPVTDVLATVKRAGAGPADDLRNVMPRVPQKERYTAFYDRDDDGEIDGPSELSALDHLLLAPALVPHLQNVRYVHGHGPAAGPDHFPVVATLSASDEPTDPTSASARK